jgi:hypothetical protein
MFRQVFIHYAGPGWLVPTTRPDNLVAYHTSTILLPNPPAGYPPVWTDKEVEWQALMELNAALREVYPGDTIVVLIPGCQPFDPD